MISKGQVSLQVKPQVLNNSCNTESLLYTIEFQTQTVVRDFAEKEMETEQIGKVDACFGVLEAKVELESKLTGTESPFFQKIAILDKQIIFCEAETNTIFNMVSDIGTEMKQLLLTETGVST